MGAGEEGGVQGDFRWRSCSPGPQEGGIGLSVQGGVFSSPASPGQGPSSSRPPRRESPPGGRLRPSLIITPALAPAARLFLESLTQPHVTQQGPALG